MPVSDPEALGFSSSRLAWIAAWQQLQIDAGAFSGTVAAICEPSAFATAQRPSRCNLIQFSDRLNDKPVISTAAMTLVEDGKLDLAAPVHQYHPRSRR
jgi:hypothetical protein